MSVQSNAAAVGVLQESFWRFDYAAEGDHMLADGRVGIADLEAVARNEHDIYTPEEQQAAQYLLAHPELIALVDTAATDSPVADGIISEQDVDAAIDSPMLADTGGSPLTVFDMPYQDTWQVLGDDFDVFDGAGDGGKLDGNISFNDLVTIAYGEEGGYSLEQRAAARYLLDHLELFRQADVSQPGVGADGLISRLDVEAMASREPPADAATQLPASLDTNGQPGLQSDEIPAGAEGLSPILYMAPDDGFLLTDPDQYVENSYVTTEDGEYVADPEQYLKANPGTTLIVDPGRYLIDDISEFDGNGVVTDGLGQVIDDPAAYLQENPGASVAVIPRGYFVSDPAQAAAANGTFYTRGGIAISDPQQYLTDNPGETLYVNPGDTANRMPDASKTYYEYDAETNSITYFYFYPNNDGPSGGVGDLQNHEGDWERVTVQLDGEYRPVTVYCSAHGGASSVSWNQIVKEDGRPVVFVARGSHANYFLPGEYPTLGAIADDQTVEDPGAGLRFDTQSTQLTNIENNVWWYGAPLQWGEEGWHKDWSGPLGPSPGPDGKNTLAPRPEPVDRPFGPE